jgi:hypothetical protein
MRKEALDDRYRIRLGPKATELSKAHCPPTEIPSSEHLEIGIDRLTRELEILAAQNKTLQSVIDGFGYRLDSFTDKQAIANRGLIMMMGQCVRELDTMRTILVAMRATSPDEAQKLLEYGAYFITKMRGTLDAWRDREGINVPQYDREEEEKVLNDLNAPPASKQPVQSQGKEREGRDTGDRERG